MKSWLSHLTIILAVIVLPPVTFENSVDASEQSSVEQNATQSSDALPSPEDDGMGEGDAEGQGDANPEANANPEDASDAKPPTPAPRDLSAILAIWRCRTDLTRTVSYAWKERFEKTGSTVTLNVGLGIGFDAFKQKADDKMLRHEHSYRFQVSDSSVCSERAGRDLHGLTGRLLYETQRDFYGPKGHVLTTVSRQATEFMPELIPVRIAVFYDTTYYAKTDYHTSPVIMHHRPLDKKRSPINEDTIRMTRDREVIDGHSCARLRDGRFEYWVDVNGLIRRQALKSNFRVDMSYSKTDHGWMLEGWSLETDDEKAVSTVTKSKVNGKPIPDSRLLQVPVGAVVQCEGKPQYIKLSNGQKRELESEDYKYGSPTYEELVNSRPGEAMPTEFVALHESLSNVTTVVEDERKLRLKKLTDYLQAQPRTLTRHVRLVAAVRTRLRAAGLDQSASKLTETCGRISEPFRRGMQLASENDRLSNTASR